MSLSLITETAAEVHRLTIAGSALASGDFRLRKLVPQLESLGAKAPVFGRIAQGVKGVIEEADAAKAGRALLDLATLLTAIQYTQSQHGVEGEIEPMRSAVESWTPTVAGYRSLAAVVEALTSTGEGRLEVVQEAAGRGLFADLRLMQPAIMALGDRFGQLADFVAEQAIPQLGPVVVPLLKAGFDPKGGVAHGRRLRALAAVDREEGRACARAALKGATKEVKVAAILGLRGSEDDLPIILSYVSDRAKDVRVSAFKALEGVARGDVLALAKAVLNEANEFSPLAAGVLAHSGDADSERELCEELRSGLGEIETSLDRLTLLLKCLNPANSAYVLDFLVSVFTQVAESISGKTDRDDLYRDRFKSPEVEFLMRLAIKLLETRDATAIKVLLGGCGSRLNMLNLCALAAAAQTQDAEEIFDNMSGVMRKKGGMWVVTYIATGSCRFCASHGLPSFPRSKISPRWTQVFVEERLPGAVASLILPGQHEAAAFLRAVASEAGEKNYLDSVRHAVSIARADPDGSTGWLLERIEAGRETKYESWYLSEIWAAVSLLPPSELPRLEQAASKVPAAWRSSFEIALAVIRKKAL